jgi:hypothetical protein
MESTTTQGLGAHSTDQPANCGRPGCPCGLPIGERFMLWALRQWQADRALPRDGSALHRGFTMAGLSAALPDFAIAMDAFFFGVRRSLEIHRPTCSDVSRDEATLVALCALAQVDCNGPLVASLDRMMAPAASRVAAERLKTFAAALANAGLRLAPLPGEAVGRLQ